MNAKGTFPAEHRTLLGDSLPRLHTIPSSSELLNTILFDKGIRREIWIDAVCKDPKLGVFEFSERLVDASDPFYTFSWEAGKTIHENDPAFIEAKAQNIVLNARFRESKRIKDALGESFPLDFQRSIVPKNADRDQARYILANYLLDYHDLAIAEQRRLLEKYPNLPPVSLVLRNAVLDTWCSERLIPQSLTYFLVQDLLAVRKLV